MTDETTARDQPRLDPVPPVDVKGRHEKALHIGEDNDLDDARLADWFEQAAGRPGWTS